MIPHPTPSDIAHVRATRERMAAHVQRGVCCICLHVYRDGVEPTSHGFCSTCEESVKPGEPMRDWRVDTLAEEMAFAWGRYVRQKEGSAKMEAAKAEFYRARERFRWALRALVESTQRP